MRGETSASLPARVFEAVLSILGPGNEAGDPHPDVERVTDAVMAVLDDYPEDVITGYPNHYIVNGDHSGCFCGGEAP